MEGEATASLVTTTTSAPSQHRSSSSPATPAHPWHTLATPLSSRAPLTAPYMAWWSLPLRSSLTSSLTLASLAWPNFSPQGRWKAQSLLLL